MLVPPALALWILCAVIVGIFGFPTSFRSERESPLKHGSEKREDTPFSFKVDWSLIDNELQSLLDEFISKKSLTSPPSVSTKPMQPSMTLSTPSTTTTIPRPPVLPVSSNPSSSVSSLPFTHSRSFSLHSSSPSPFPSPSPSPSSSPSPPRSPSSSPVPSSSSRSLSSSSTRRPSSSSSQASPSPSPLPKPVSSSSDSTSKTITTITTTIITTTTSASKTTTITTVKSTTAVSAVPTRTGTPSIQPPYFVVYTDESAFGFPTSEEIKGFNTVVLSFFLSNSEAADQAAAWAGLPASKRDSITADYRANNISLMVSALGSTEAPTTRKIDPVQYAKDVAAWAIQFGMEGVDVDYEDFDAVGAGTALEWLVTFTTTLRTALPDHMVISHAPVAPWFVPGGVYSQLEHKIGAAIDFYNVQFYSQGVLYTTCDGLLSTSGGVFPNSSLFELIDGGIPAKKLVIGKPGTLLDVGVSVDLLGVVSVGADPVVHSTGTTHSKRDSITNTNGFMDPDLLAKCLVHAVSQNWNTGVMAWEYPDANSTWIQTVRSLAFPSPSN